MADEDHTSKSKHKRKKTQANEEDTSCNEGINEVPAKKKNKLNKEAKSGEEVEVISNSKKVKRKTHNKSEKDEEQSQISSDISNEITEITKSDETELARKKKKKRAKDSVSSSLGIIDNELVETAEKNLQVNGLDVATAAVPQNTIGNESNLNEKKQKKKKKSKNKESQSCAKKNANLYSKNHIEQAITYLHTWNQDKKSWKFNKVHQLRLIHMMYDASIVNNDDFQTLLLYLEGMKGKSKETTNNQAIKFVNGEVEKGEEVSVAKEQRAREVVQVLS